MKKFFAAALASAMVVSMAATSFAAPAAVTGVYNSGDKPVLYKESNGLMKLNDGLVGYGKTAFFALTSDADLKNVPVTEYDAVKGTSIKVKWEIGATAVEKLEIVKKKNGSQDYSYYLAVSTKANSTTKETDVAGTVNLRKSGSPSFDLKDDKAVSISFTLGYASADDTIVDKVRQDLVTDTAKIFNFTTANAGDADSKIPEADEYEISLPGDNYFLVNTIGQGKIILAADMDYNADIAAKYPNANLDFFNGNGATFNKIGELTLMADEGSFLYQVNADGNLVAVKYTYDEYEEAFKVKTRVLGSYVISDVELKLTATTPVDPAKPNPGTGANA